MNNSISIFAPVDLNEERRVALAKIYSLLIRLAESQDEISEKLSVTPKEEKVAEPTVINSEL